MKKTDELFKYAEEHSYEDIARNHACYEEEDVNFMLLYKIKLEDILEQNNISATSEENDLEI